MPSVRIVADDLTGALDAAAPFAMADGPLPIVWDAARAAGLTGSLALDLESRDAPQAPADAGWVETLAGADVAFKKLDSLLRGRPAEELRACIASGRFATVVIAPAFPAQRRITRDGRQYWRGSAEAPWRAVERDLAGELRALAVDVCVTASAGQVAGAGVILFDAETEAELRAIADAGSRLEGPVLWAGTAGLAHALAGPPARTVAPPTAPWLAVVGSHHPVARAQVEALARARPDAIVRVRSTSERAEPTASALTARLGAARSAALVFDFPDGTPSRDAERAIGRILEDLVRRVERPCSLVVTGGATLFMLMRASGATALEVRGELLPGIAASTIAGGALDGAGVISKSGAFGDADTLVYLAGLLEAPRS